MQQPIYLDYNATTPVDPRVIDAMLPYLREDFGNASSSHAYGIRAHQALDRARGQVAALLNADPGEIVFTGGGSETNNLALKGTAFVNLKNDPHIVSTTVEHPAVMNTLRYLEQRFGVAYTLVAVDDTGVLDLHALCTALASPTCLVSVMHANNEVGTIQPLARIAAIVHEAGALLHVDAAQSAGKVPIDVKAMGIDLLTIAGHKLYAPKGIGVLYLRRGVTIDPLVHGSSQELGMRAGTEPVASVVALGKAAELAREDVAAEAVSLTALRDRLHTGLAARIPGLQLNGHPTERLPNTLNVSAPGTDGQSWLGMTPDVAASTGSACHSASASPSPVLTAMGLSRERAAGAVRLSLGRWTTADEIDAATSALAESYALLTGLDVSVG
jgi:cysteine desulfurase